MKDDIRLKTLYAKYIDGQCTASELQELLDHFEVKGGKSTLLPLIRQQMEQGQLQQGVSSEQVGRVVAGADKAIAATMGVDRGHLPAENHGHSLARNGHLFRYAAAVLLFLAIGLGLYWYQRDTIVESKMPMQVADKILPGGNKASLSLSNGRSIALREDQSGITLSDDGIQYGDGTPISDLQAVSYATLLTPLGGTYRMTLPDGSHVWLNAGSSLRYPTHFDGAERRVELEGEGYFEVAQNKKQPFVVVSKGQSVQVLGTSFNVQAYADAPTKTTLIEGSVRLSATVTDVSAASNAIGNQILKPNQQSILIADRQVFEVHTVDPDIAVAWKNGYFQFQDADIQTVMQQMARWYNLEISYVGEIPKQRFDGKVYRNMTLGQVLDILSFSKIQFDLKGREMTIYPKGNP